MAGPIPHGTITGYYSRAHNCRCRECKDAAAAYSREKNRAKPKNTRPCIVCGKGLKQTSKTEPACRTCVPRLLRRRTRERRRAELLVQLATPITGPHPWTQGPCEWCGQVFLRIGVTTFCSEYCRRRTKAVRRRGRIANTHGTYTWVEVITIHLLFDRRCAYCSTPMDVQPDPDHVVPLSRGGLNSITNILPCCSPCNSDKRDLLLNEWALDRQRRALPPVTTTWQADDPRFQHLTITACRNTQAA